MKKIITTLTELEKNVSDGDIIYLEFTNKPEFNGWWIACEDFLMNIDDKIEQAQKAESKTVPQNTYIDATHFGSTKPYTWRVPEYLKSRVEQGKIAKVKTKHGDQIVEIVKVYKREVEPSVHRCVVDVLDV